MWRRGRKDNDNNKHCDDKHDDSTATSGNECADSHDDTHVETATDRVARCHFHHGSPEAQRARFYRDHVACGQHALPKTGGQRTRAMSVVAAVTVALGVSLLSVARIGRSAEPLAANTCRLTFRHVRELCYTGYGG